MVPESALGNDLLQRPQVLVLTEKAERQVQDLCCTVDTRPVPQQRPLARLHAICCVQRRRGAHLQAMETLDIRQKRSGQQQTRGALSSVQSLGAGSAMVDVQAINPSNSFTLTCSSTTLTVAATLGSELQRASASGCAELGSLMPPTYGHTCAGKVSTHSRIGVLFLPIALRTPAKSCLSCSQETCKGARQQGQSQPWKSPRLRI